MVKLLLLHDGMVMSAFLLFSSLISYLSIPIIIRAAKNKYLFDKPDNERKLHTKAIPTLGGIAIFFAFLLSFSVSPWASSFEGFPYFVAALLILLIVGLKDDLVVLSAGKKMMAQITASALVIFGGEILISDFYGVLGLGQIPYWVAVPITMVTIIGIINAINLIDGIDGLAAGIGLIASLIFGTSFAFVGQYPMAVFSFCLAGGLIGFLYYNFSPASIFMGDTGSMILGFLLSIQAVEFVGLGGHPEFHEIFGNAAPILAITILIFPLFDTFRVMVKRLRRNCSIFEAGKDHVHHEMLRMGLSHKKASLLLYGQSLALIITMVLLSVFKINVNVLLGALFLFTLFAFPTNGTKRSILAKLFGIDWQLYRSQMWGMNVNYDKATSFNDSNVQKSDHNIEKKLEETEEIESVAI